MPRKPRQQFDDQEEFTKPTTRRASAKRNKYPQQTSEGLFLKTKIVPRTYGQSFYLDMLRESTITLCSGPAGCGKTWLVAGVALERLFNHDIDKIIITKPIVEAGGEEIGFLPGLVEDKILPHFQSVLDCFEDHIGPSALKKLQEEHKLIFLPTAFARGKSLQNAFILIDEAQNLTRKGIKLLMTRISEGSVMAINGDADQVDIPENTSGLQWAIDSLTSKSSEIGVVKLTDSDIQRHPIISVILKHLK
jgi:phosphate starvation-inducible protein PhoH and related proteins